MSTRPRGFAHRMSSPTPIVARLQHAAETSTGIRFVGASVPGDDGDYRVLGTAPR